MAIFLYRLLPPRPTFPDDMTSTEKLAMEVHFGYWHDEVQKGTALVVGPVADPDGTYGLAILNVADERAAKRLCAEDPVIKANLGFSYELHPMPNAMVKET